MSIERIGAGPEISFGTPGPRGSNPPPSAPVNPVNDAGVDVIMAGTVVLVGALPKREQ